MIFRYRLHDKIRSIVLTLSKGSRGIWIAYYSLAIHCFSLLVKVRRALGHWPVVGVYLRRSGAVNDLTPGASDLDFFLWIETATILEEEEFLKQFWRNYRWVKTIFPILGEVQIGQGDELALWLRLPLVRSQEARFWKTLMGPNTSALVPMQAIHELDLFHEALKAYAEIMRILQRMDPHQSTSDLRRILALRNVAKGYCDLLRFSKLKKASTQTAILALKREELVSDDPFALALLHAHPSNNLNSKELSQWLDKVIPHLFVLMEEMADQARADNSTAENFLRIPDSPPADHAFAMFSLSAERLLKRNIGVEEIWCSFSRNQMILRLGDQSSLPPLLNDLRQLHLGFGRFGLALPLGPLAFSAYASSGAFDLTFHGTGPFSRILPDSKVSFSFCFLGSRIPSLTLQRIALELSFSLRIPPEDPEHYQMCLVPSILRFRPYFASGQAPDLLYSKSPPLNSTMEGGPSLWESVTDQWSDQFPDLRRELGLAHDQLFLQKTRLRM